MCQKSKASFRNGRCYDRPLSVLATSKNLLTWLQNASQLINQVRIRRIKMCFHQSATDLHTEYEGEHRNRVERRGGLLRSFVGLVAAAPFEKDVLLQR